MKGDRLISLNAAIDALNKRWRTCIIGESLIRDAGDTLKALPSAQPGWIPVTERLPDGEGRTIVTTKWDDGYTVSYAYYWGAVGKWGSITDNVIAWMPLPKPWEGRQDE